MSSTESHPDTRAPDWAEVQASPEFQQLRHRLRRFVFPVTGLFLAWYLVYVLLASYAPSLMSIKIVGNINVALLFGLLQFVTTFLIAWYYSRFAAQKIDPIADKIRADLDAENPAEITTTAPDEPASDGSVK